ncbi:MAG: prepilin peptidase [Candidatus Altiarchaeota archaeon]|nr:prepilin peptidase [Candidatus Altiarchaeota archaeon]
MHLFLDMVSVGVAVGGCMAGVVCDVKTRRIPNKLTGCLLLISLPLALTKAFFVESSFLWLYLMNFIFGFLVAFTLWSIRAWSGGDAKMFWVLASLIPVYPTTLMDSFIKPPYYSHYFFFITILFNLGLILLTRFFITAVYKYIKEKKIPGLVNLFITPVLYLMASTLISIGLFNSTRIPPIISSILVIYCLTLIKRCRSRYLVSCILIIAGLIMSGVSDTGSLTSLIAANKSLFAFILLLSTYAVGSRIPLSKTMEIRDVKKGMAIAEELYFREGVLVREDVTSSLRDLIRNRKRKTLIHPRPVGLTEEDIGILNNYRDDLEGVVKINISFILMPFMFISLIMSMLGDFLWLMLT